MGQRNLYRSIGNRSYPGRTQVTLKCETYNFNFGSRRAISGRWISHFEVVGACSGGKSISHFAEYSIYSHKGTPLNNPLIEGDGYPGSFLMFLYEHQKRIEPRTTFTGTQWTVTLRLQHEGPRGERFNEDQYCHLRWG